MTVAFPFLPVIVLAGRPQSLLAAAGGQAARGGRQFAERPPICGQRAHGRGGRAEPGAGAQHSTGGGQVGGTVARPTRTVGSVEAAPGRPCHGKCPHSSYL